MKTEMKNSWKTFYIDILRKPFYWICIAFVVILSYLFDLVNRTIGIDDLARPWYYRDDNTMLAGTRWGKNVWVMLLTDVEYAPFIDKFMSIIFLIISAVLFVKIIYPYIRTSKYKLLLCALFSCLYISYPLVNEIWNYNDANIIYTGNAMAAAICLELLYAENKIFSRKTLVCSLLLSIVLSSYESTAFMYVSAVISILLLDLVTFGKKNWFYRGIIFAIPLIFAFLLRYIIGFSIIHVMGLSYRRAGNTAIRWDFGGNILDQIKVLLRNIFFSYFFNGLIYYPIFVFLISLFAISTCMFVLAYRRRCFLIILLYGFLILSIFFQSIIQGLVMPYRTAQVLQFFCPLSLAMSLYFLSCLNRKTLMTSLFIMAAYICYRQGVFMNRTLALNNQRSNNEAAIVYEIGMKIKRIDEAKPVYIVGWVDLGENIDRQNRPDQHTLGGYLYRKIAIHYNLPYEGVKIYDSDVNSVINWNLSAFTIKDIMDEYFSYFGFDFDIKHFTTWKEHNFYAKEVSENGLNPYDVRDMGDHILVYIR